MEHIYYYTIILYTKACKHCLPNSLWCSIMFCLHITEEKQDSQNHNTLIGKDEYYYLLNSTIILKHTEFKYYIVSKFLTFTDFLVLQQGQVKATGG